MVISSSIRDTARSVRVGVWPGQSRDGNVFPDLFADGLRQAGAQVIDIQTPDQIRPGAFDILHIHWPEQVFWIGGGRHRMAARMLRTTRRLRHLRRSGVRIVWMVHNLEPHDMSWRRRVAWWFYRRELCSVVDGFMTLSPATIASVRIGLPGLRGKPARFAWMPAYPKIEPQPTREQIRSRHGIQDHARVFAFLGLLRPYKGVEKLVEIFRQLPGEGFQLLLVGAPADAAYAALLEAMAREDPRIHLVFRHLSNSEFSGYQAAADFVVLPFHQYLHSASIVYAISHHTPVLTPRTAYAHALGNEVGDGWVQTYERSLDPSFLQNCRRPDGAPRLMAFSSASAGRDALAFYRYLLHGPLPPARETEPCGDQALAGEHRSGFHVTLVE